MAQELSSVADTVIKKKERKLKRYKVLKALNLSITHIFIGNQRKIADNVSPVLSHLLQCFILITWDNIISVKFLKVRH